MPNSKQSRGKAQAAPSTAMQSDASSASLEHLTQRLSEEYVAPAMDRMKEMVDERPMSAVMTVMGLGFGVGLLVAAALAPPPRKRVSTAEQIGHQVLDAVTRVLPASITQSLRR